MMSPPKRCAVCGDKALGYNFSAVTCESCKAFFRRNALAKKEFTCPFEQKCVMTVVTRRFCQKCRLRKCIEVGMKSENIMSEEDKLIKRRKIETNRAKRRLNKSKPSNDDDNGREDVKREHTAADSSSCDGVANDEFFDSQSCASFDSGNGGAPTSSRQAATSSTTTASEGMLGEQLKDVSPQLMTGEEMVEFIVNDPDRASQAISKLMRTPAEALATLEKIINSQKDALRLISHLISYPGDALKIISKIMNSPLNALTVFTKFMSSPTDALEIISKIVDSPKDVLQFIKQLMENPEDGVNIMNKFMNSPAEALKILNGIFNGSSPENNEIGSHATANESLPPMTALGANNDLAFQAPITPISQIHSPEMENISVSNSHTLIQTMLNSNSPNGAGHASHVIPQQQQQQQFTQMHHPSSPFTPSPQSLSIASPVSMAPSDLQYHSPSSLQHDELPSTSAGLISTSPTNLTSNENDFNSDAFDIKAFIQNSFPDNASGGGGGAAGEGINSLESVLTEVIRIEFQAFNNLPPEPRVKQEQYTMSSIHGPPYVNTCGTVPDQALQQQQNEQHQQPICAPSSVMMSRDLNEAEQMKLRELKLASEALYYPVDAELDNIMMGDERIKSGDSRQDPKLLQVINLTAVAIKRLIKMAKKINAFRNMCQEDQVALLKGGCTEMMIMRSVMTYDDNRNTWKIPHTQEDMSNIRAEVLKLAKGNVYEEHLKFIRTFDEKWRMDENIILIMCAIVLFTPSRPRIVHSDVIRLEQNSYYYLLRRYLESVYTGCEARSAFIKLIQKISDVERLNQFIIGVYLNVNPSQVEPLLREIFDLKNH